MWQTVLNARDKRRLASLRCWTRQDAMARCTRLPGVHGPRWTHVHRRVVIDAASGKVLADQDMRGVTSKAELYATVPGGPRDTITKFYHTDPKITDPGAEDPTSGESAHAACCFRVSVHKAFPALLSPMLPAASWEPSNPTQCHTTQCLAKHCGCYQKS